MQSKSITALKAFNDGHFLDFYFHRMNDTLSNKNLASLSHTIGKRPSFLAFSASSRSRLHDLGLNLRQSMRGIKGLIRRLVHLKNKQKLVLVEVTHWQSAAHTLVLSCATFYLCL